MTRCCVNCQLSEAGCDGQRYVGVCQARTGQVVSTPGSKASFLWPNDNFKKLAVMTETYFGLKLNLDSFTITKEEKQQGQAQYSDLELWSRYDTGVKSRQDQSLSRVSLSSILDNVLLEH